MKITAKIEGIEGLNKSLQKFADVVGKDISAILPDEARLYCASAMQAQPPTVSKGKGSGSGKGSNTTAARKGGEAAIARSHANASPRYFPENFMSPAMQRCARAGDLRMLQYLIDLSDASLKVGNFNPAYVESRRNNGRVFKPKRGNILITDAAESDRDAYTKKKHGNVGMMKGAWAALIEKLNAITPSRSRVPSWIARNARKGQAWLGTRVDIRLTGNKKQIAIYGATHPSMDAFEEIALRSRIKSINKKTREILAGRAGIINGKFTIFKGAPK